MKKNKTILICSNSRKPYNYEFKHFLLETAGVHFETDFSKFIAF